MGLEAIDKEIKQVVLNTANDLISQATADADQIIIKAKDKAKNIEIQVNQQTDQIISQLKNSFLAQAKFEIKKNELISKKNLVNLIFNKAKEEISKLNDKTVKELTIKLYNNAKKQLDVKYVLCNKNTAKALLIDKGITVEIVEMLGGIIAENKDRTLRIDNSFDTILEDVRRDFLAEISKGLFK